jgi:ZIP family zinc transporter
MGLAAGLGTCLGAVVILLFGHIRDKTFSLLLGLAAGVMLAVILLDLLPSALSYGRLTQCLEGIFAGLLFIGLIDLVIGKDTLTNGKSRRYLALGYLIASGIAIHDLPEGLAIAAGYVEPLTLGPLLTLAIGLHNIPEGMATAAPLRAGGMSASHVLAINMLLSLVTPLGSAVGLILMAISTKFIAFLLTFAGGAMSYIVFLKLIPESWQHHRPFAYGGFFSGITLVAFLNLLFQQ